ncbi:MAG: TonB-dependent receptor [Pseudazoarcus pumilus]|nr:TonB-dependent receptor [Pseudazoarcus pumilus]
MLRPHHRLKSLPVLIAALLSGKALAQAEPATPQLAPVTVSASALSLGASDMILPFSVLDAEALLLERAGTLGETLERQPGVRSSGFAPGAGRPVIRGLDGARVRVLSDGSEIMDASTISPDHAVATETLLLERIEILRGPSALAYGGGATGGVVNLIDARIPTEVPEDGIEGTLELRGNTAANEAAGAFGITAGSGNFALRAEGARRDARDLRVGRGWDEGRKVEGSFSQSETGSLGLSWIGKRGYLGIAYSSERRDYGLPGHVEAHDCEVVGGLLDCDDHDDHDHEGEHADVPMVDLHSQRWDLRGEVLEPFAGIARIGLRASHTDYRHDEIEDGEIATRFRSKAHDARVEVEHQPIAGWRGVIGLQNTRRDFSATGEEAYVPPTLTQRNALFLIEEYRLGDWRFEAGLRHERQRIDVDSTARDRSHSGTSVSVGANWAFAPGYSLGVSLARAQRMPSAEELYADGLHLATRTIEIGNPELERETSRNLDITLRKLTGDTTFSIGVFHNRVNDYIFANTLDEHEGLRLIEYAQRDASFTGLEVEVRQQLNRAFAVTGFGDYVRGKLKSSADSDLPRIPAWRAGLRLDATYGAWQSEVEWVHVGSQTQVADYESKTGSYNLINLGASYSARYNTTPFQVYVKLHNLTDKLAFNHASFNKDEVPLAGRSLMAGVRVQF